jgi:hypothetical protein
LSQSVTLLGIEALETGNTETPDVISPVRSLPDAFLKAAIYGPLTESTKPGTASAMSLVQQK